MIYGGVVFSVTGDLCISQWILNKIRTGYGALAGKRSTET